MCPGRITVRALPHCTSRVRVFASQWKGGRFLSHECKSTISICYGNSRRRLARFINMMLIRNYYNWVHTNIKKIIIKECLCKSWCWIFTNPFIRFWKSNNIAPARNPLKWPHRMSLTGKRPSTKCTETIPQKRGRRPSLKVKPLKVKLSGRKWLDDFYCGMKLRQSKESLSRIVRDTLYWVGEEEDPTSPCLSNSFS